MQNINKNICCCCSVAKSCPTLCDPMDYSMPCSPVLHYLLEFAQIHIHGVGDANQPSHPLSPPSPPALSLSQHQGLFWALPCSCLHHDLHTVNYITALKLNQ